MDTALFRHEVTDQASSDWLGPVRLATPVSLRIWTFAALGMATAVLAWLALGSYTRREKVTGQLIPQAGLIDLAANAAGTVSRVMVSEGGRVREGDPLVALSGEHVSESLGGAESSVSQQLRGQLAQLDHDIADTGRLAAQQGDDLRAQITKLDGQLHQIDTQVGIQLKQVASLQQVLDKVAPLLHKGYIPLLEVEQQKMSLLSAQSQAESLRQQHFAVEQQAVSLRDQLDQLPTSTAVKLGDLRRQRAQIAQTLAQNEAGRASVLRAPRDGMVSSLLVRPGQAVIIGQAMLAIVPADSPMQAQLLVPSRAAGFVHPGMEVVLHYQPFPYQKFGLQRGVVRKVSESALSPSEVSLLLGGQPPVNEPQYRILVDLPAQDVQVYGRAERLRPGMAVEGDLLLDRRRIYEWIFEPLYAAGRQLGSHR